MGRALRDAAPDLKQAPFPLVIVSHGYPGSRVLLTYLTENLASKGYIVVAIDHTESTHHDLQGFPSTLLNRNKDILFVLNQIADLGKTGSNNFLAGLVDADHTALIGYSMGGYGVLNVAGAGYSEKFAGFFGAMTSGSKAIQVLTSNNEQYKSSFDSRIKAVVAFAPWGMQRGVWDTEGLKGLKVPVFFVAGSQDDVSGYEDGTKAIFDGAVNADRYLLTYENARHNTAPNPPPPASLQPGFPMADYYHYAEPAWNEHRINNINQHFVTAFIGIYLKKKDFGKYLMPDEKAKQKNWPGFRPRAFVGLELLHAGN
jgi:predicted dienelactone hydrolase